MPPSRATAFRSLCSSRWGWSSRNRSKAIFGADSGSEARSDMRIGTFRSGRHTPNSVEKKPPNNWETRSRDCWGVMASLGLARGTRFTVFTQDLRRVTVPDGPRSRPDIQSSAWDLRARRLCSGAARAVEHPCAKSRRRRPRQDFLSSYLRRRPLARCGQCEKPPLDLSERGHNTRSDCLLARSPAAAGWPK
jgi:hypothetical protein